MLPLAQTARADSTACAIGGGLRSITVRSGGLDRIVATYFPFGRQTGKLLPLVLDLHGSNSNGEEQAQDSRFRQLADRRGVIVASPDGAVVLNAQSREFAWNIPGVPLVTDELPSADTPDDVQFIDDLIQTLVGAHCADPRRVYATGMSGGGRMSSLLGCRLSKRIAAIAPVAGLRAGSPAADRAALESGSCVPERAMPVLSFHGTGDLTNPYAGAGSPYWGYPVEAALARWAQLDGCKPKVQRLQVSAYVSRLRYGGCRDGAEVSLFVTDLPDAQGGGHVWPGSPLRLQSPSDESGSAPNSHLNASALALDFFARHALAASAPTMSASTHRLRRAELIRELGSHDAERRESALDALILAPDSDPAVVRQLAKLLDDADAYVAGKAVTALAGVGAGAFAALSEALEQGSAQQRWGATLALYQSNAEIDSFLPALTQQLAQKDDKRLRASLSALERLQARAAPALSALRPLLRHEQPEIRWATLATLAAIGPAAQPLLPDLAPLLGDALPELRLAAASAFRRIQPPRPITNERLAAHTDWLRQHLPTLMREHMVPGVSIAIIQERSVRWAQGFGVSDVRRQQPVTTDTIFEACSMSKPILALSALQLIQQRRLDLDAPLTQYLGHDYLRDQPEQGRITARMALTHRTGLPNWRIGYDEMGGPLPVLFPPGSEYTYSGEGFLFLQRAMETIAGLTLDRYAQQGLFAPLGLQHTSYVWTPDIEKDLASGHREDGSFKARTRYRKANGAYSLYTTPTDYARLMLTLMRPESPGDAVFTPASVELLLQRSQRVDDADAVVRPGLARSVATYRAIGWSVEVSADGDIVQHSGSNSSGFRSFGQFNRDKGSGLVIFTNGDGGAKVRDAVLAQIGDL